MIFVSYKGPRKKKILAHWKNDIISPIRLFLKLMFDLNSKGPTTCLRFIETAAIRVLRFHFPTASQFKPLLARDRERIDSELENGEGTPRRASQVCDTFSNVLIRKESKF
jgi:hypothetical protein